MIKIFFIFLSVFQINSAIIEALQVPEKPIHPKKAFGVLHQAQKMPQLETIYEEYRERARISREEVKKYEKDMEEYEEILRKYKEESKQFWPNAYKKAEKWWRDMPKWKESFDISNGNAAICHDEKGIRIVSNFVCPFDRDNTGTEIDQYQEPSDEIYLTQWQGQKLEHPLRLKRHSSRDDFVIELIRSGLYKGTASEQAMYEYSGNWDGHHTVVGLFLNAHENTRSRACRSIEHTEIGITLWDDKEARIGAVCSSVELFGFDGRKIHLNHKQSYYEFMMRLVETGHVSFRQYPPYTIQGRSRIDRFGKEKIYYECYYYGDIPTTEDPLYQASELERKMQEQKRCRKQVEKHQKLAQEISSLVIDSALTTFSALATEKEKNRKMASQTVLGNVSQDIKVVEITTQRSNLLNELLNGIRPVFTLPSNPFKNFQRNK